jgi:Flp pilus assembly protein TadG
MRIPPSDRKEVSKPVIINVGGNRPMTRRRERGATLILVVVGLLALIAMAGLALDTAHVLLNKSRLQSALDAAALAGAKSLDQSDSTATATFWAAACLARISGIPSCRTP